MLPEGGEHIEDMQEWHRRTFQSDFKPRTRILSLRLPYEDTKQGQYTSDKVEFVIVKDHKNRTDNLAAKEVPKVFSSLPHSSLFLFHTLRCRQK